MGDNEALNSSDDIPPGLPRNRLREWLYAAEGIAHAIRRYRSPVPESEAWDAVKLVHADDLQEWDVFKRCQDFTGISYGQYRAEARQLKRRRKSVAPLLRAREELVALDHGGTVEYDSELVDVPRSLFGKTVRVPLKGACRPGTSVRTDVGTVSDGFLEAQSGVRSKSTLVTYEGPSNVVHALRIEELQRRLDDISDEERQTVQEVTASRFAHPVLFISHRWEGDDHPDPSGEQLRRLRALKDCFVVYDYSAFPQPPRSEEEQAEFLRLLGVMDDIIRNVVILSGPDYLSRGWCVYEYLVSALRGGVVCDEVRAEPFVVLRDWVATPPPFTAQLRDSLESQQQNFINEQILRSVNGILPIYKAARFRDEHDSTVVKELLLAHLERALPGRKEHQELQPDWRQHAWSRDELVRAFDDEIPVPQLETLPILRFQTNTPSSLQEAVERRYEVKRLGSLELLNPMSSIARVDWRGFGRKRS